jgi:hypothetical protein
VRSRLLDLFRSAAEDLSRSRALARAAAAEDFELLAVQFGMHFGGVSMVDVSLVDVFPHKLGAAVVGQLVSGDFRAPVLVWVGRCRAEYLRSKSVGTELRRALADAAAVLVGKFPAGTADGPSIVEAVLPQLSAKLEELGVMASVARPARGK